MAVLAFDIYGTLINTHAVTVALERIISDKKLADTVAKVWREKQLEYSFRRGLMRLYQDFSVCTQQALEYCCREFQLIITPEQKQELLSLYRVLPAFDDVIESLKQLSASKHELYAFSNGKAEAVEQLLMNANVRNYFSGVVSVDDLQTFKPNPDVYQYLKEKTQCGNDVWLVSSNPFDVIGALVSDVKAVWVQRNTNTVFDPWGYEPTITVQSLRDISSQLPAE